VAHSIYELLKYPVISEKSNKVREEQGKYSFIVRLDATKLEIKKAVAKAFDVKVVDVRTSISPGKQKRRGVHVVTPKKKKKAIVTLAEGQKIKIFEDQ